MTQQNTNTMTSRNKELAARSHPRGATHPRKRGYSLAHPPAAGQLNRRPGVYLDTGSSPKDTMSSPGMRRLP